MREIEEKPIREQYSRELTELTSRREAWSPEEAIDEQIEREAKELRPLLEALRNLAQASALTITCSNVRRLGAASIDPR